LSCARAPSASQGICALNPPHGAVSHMPMFMDKHQGAEMAGDMRKNLENEVRTKKKDANGVITRGVVMDQQAREMMCICEAPNEEAVRKHHQDAGMQISELHRVDAIL
jgi:hypothetical protein